MNSRQARQDLTKTLRLDLIGPTNGSEFETGLLSETPTAWYLAGYLVPADADDELRLDDTSEEEIDAAPAAGGFDDDAPVDRSAAGHNYLPSSMGMTTIIPAEAKAVTVTVAWGDYIEEKYEEASEGGEPKILYGYRRIPRTASIEIPLASLNGTSQTLLDVPESKTRPRPPPRPQRRTLPGRSQRWPTRESHHEKESLSEETIQKEAQE